MKNLDTQFEKLKLFRTFWKINPKFWIPGIKIKIIINITTHKPNRKKDQIEKNPYWSSYTPQSLRTCPILLHLQRLTEFVGNEAHEDGLPEEGAATRDAVVPHGKTPGWQSDGWHSFYSSTWLTNFLRLAIGKSSFYKRRLTQNIGIKIHQDNIYCLLLCNAIPQKFGWLYYLVSKCP